MEGYLADLTERQRYWLEHIRACDTAGLYGPNKESHALCSLTIIETEHAAKALSPFDGAGV
jgi:hypothetical protein